MNFEDFISKKQVRRTTPDISLVKSLVSCAENDVKYLDTQEITLLSSRKVAISYYDTLRSIVEAVAENKGYKVYSHEALTAFLEKNKENILAQKFDRLRKLRNKLNYYGGSISVEEVKEMKKEITKISLFGAIDGLFPWFYAPHIKTDFWN